jgi:hypothetical protein
MESSKRTAWTGAFQRLHAPRLGFIPIYMASPISTRYLCSLDRFLYLRSDGILVPRDTPIHLTTFLH